MPADAPTVRTHSVRPLDIYGVRFLECRGCGEHWDLPLAAISDLNQEPCGTRSDR